MVNTPGKNLPWWERAKANVLGERHSALVATELRYVLFACDTELPVTTGWYDREGTVYVWEGLLREDERYADLTAFHEHVEMRHKAAGRPHAYAHRRAMVEELLAVKQVFPQCSELRRYLRWKLGWYPRAKLPDPDAVASELERLLDADRPRKGELLKVVTERRL